MSTPNTTPGATTVAFTTTIRRCEFPERNEEISEHLSRARSSLADVDNRIRRLEEDPQQLYD